MPADSRHPLLVEQTHPSLPGHFPGMPVVPGVVLLSKVLAELRRQRPELRVTGIRKLKFQRMLLPEQGFTVEFGAVVEQQLRFKCWQNNAVLTEGHLMLAALPAAVSSNLERQA